MKWNAHVRAPPELRGPGESRAARQGAPVRGLDLEEKEPPPGSHRQSYAAPTGAMGLSGVRRSSCRHVPSIFRSMSYARAGRWGHSVTGCAPSMDDDCGRPQVKSRRSNAPRASSVPADTLHKMAEFGIVS